MIRIAHVLRKMDTAGTETMIMNLYRKLDKNSFQFDFIVNDRGGDYEEEILDLGGNIYQVPAFTGLNVSSYAKAFRSVLAEHPDLGIVHGHIGSSASIYLHEANKMDRKTIAHSHSINAIERPLDIAWNLFVYPTRFIADRFLGCSAEAIESRYGKKIARSGKSHVLPNALDLDGYVDVEKFREQTKNGLGLTAATIYGHVGRFVPEKNHEFLIDVFNRIHKEDPNTQLLLVGQGPLEDEVRKQVDVRGLSDSVVFAGRRTDIPKVLSAMDVFIFPSPHEGLGMSAVEAQAAGVPALLSSGLPEEAFITPNTKKLELSAGSEHWAEEARVLAAAPRNQKNDLSLVQAAGFDINKSVDWLQNFYASLDTETPNPL
jgi:glycosyltransferase involved in cell wall biosynthesis